MVARYFLGVLAVDVFIPHIFSAHPDDMLATEVDIMPEVSSLLQVSMQTTRQVEASPRKVGRVSARCQADSLSTKDLDLVIFGAYGFTGKLSAEYLGQGHPENPRWAIAGRKDDELQALLNSLPNKPHATIVADLANVTSLDALTRRTKVVLTYAGPYEFHGGEALILSAIDNCAHYVDITGENQWKLSMLSKYEALARKRGVIIVQSAGLDSMPADLMGMLAAESFASEQKDPPDEVTAVFTKFNGWVSGGTLATGVYARAAHRQEITDPYFLVPANSSRQCQVDVQLDGIESYGYDPKLQATLKPQPSGNCDGPVLRRSLSVRFPSSCIHAGVCKTTEADKRSIEFSVDSRMLTNPPPLAPLPGQGPPRWIREEGSFALHGVARGSSTPIQRCVTMSARGDPGYFATARMSTELALGLTLGADKFSKGGYQTPSLALGPQNLKARLEKVLHLDGKKSFTFGDTCPFEQRVSGLDSSSLPTRCGGLIFLVLLFGLQLPLTLSR